MKQFNLSEEIQSGLKDMYQGLCDGLKEELGKMHNDLEDICKDVQYEPLQNTVNKTIALVSDEIKKNSDKTFEEWINGEASFEATTKRFQGGDRAVETAKNIQGDIENIYNGFWVPNPLGDAINVDTSMPDVENDTFEKLSKVYDTYADVIKQKNDEVDRKLKEKENDDPTYTSLRPAVKAITGSMQEAFTKFKPTIMSLKDVLDRRIQEQTRINEEAVEAASRTSASMEDIAAGLQMLDDE
jgi:hypothetical protein